MHTVDQIKLNMHVYVHSLHSWLYKTDSCPVHTLFWHAWFVWIFAQPFQCTNSTTQRIAHPLGLSNSCGSFPRKWIIFVVHDPNFLKGTPIPFIRTLPIICCLHDASSFYFWPPSAVSATPWHCKSKTTWVQRLRIRRQETQQSQSCPWQKTSAYLSAVFGTPSAFFVATGATWPNTRSVVRQRSLANSVHSTYKFCSRCS